MKRKLLLISGCIGFMTYTVCGQSFTPGNLAVYRYGDGTESLPNDRTVPVFIDEYTPTGTLVKTRAIPTTSNGSNFRLTGLGRNADGTYPNEGMSTLSQDGKYLTIIGYNQAPSSAVTGAANGLVVGVIAADGSYNSSTTISNEASTGIGSPRSAVFDGTSDIWVNGSQNGIQYTTLGANSSTRVSNGQESSKSLTIAKTWASGVLQPSRLYVASATASNELPYATPLPKSITTFTTSATFPSAITANQIAIFTINNRTIIYVADDTNNTIRRYFLNFSGGALGGYTNNISEPATSKIKSITGVTRTSGSNTIIDIYATTWGHDGNGTETSKLITFSDSYVTSNPTNSPADNILATSTTTIATAPANTLFKSVTLVPTGSTAVGAAVLPIRLGIFRGKTQDKGIKLTWTTLNEHNNAYFKILRSGDGKRFEPIGSLASKGDSDDLQEYTFFDPRPLSGTNYYQLSQVDFDEKSTNSKIISVEYSLAAPKTTFSINTADFAKGMNVTVYSPETIPGKITIYNLKGQQTSSLTVTLSKGESSFVVPFNDQPGIYLVSLITRGEKITDKVIITQ